MMGEMNWSVLKAQFIAREAEKFAINTHAKWFAYEKAFNQLPVAYRQLVLKIANIPVDRPLAQYSKADIKALGQACRDLCATAHLLQMVYSQEKVL